MTVRPSPTPPLFVSHGAPTLLLNPGATGAAWQKIADTLPTPQAILVISAHWVTRQPAVSAALTQPILHDFAGFPRELYAFDYPAPGSPALAKRVSELVSGVRLDSARGLDHGAWVPLRLMYPQANIPVAQLSVVHGLSAAGHRALGAALAPLTQEGVLIIGSGSLTHNLHDVDFNAPDDVALDYVSRFREQFVAALLAGDLGCLDDYLTRMEHAQRAHPTPEHLLPLFVALGAAGAGAVGTSLFAGYTYGALAMDALSFATE